MTGLVPALQITRPQPRRPRSRAPRGATDGSHRKRARSLLIGGEVALAFVLLVGAGLMGRTMLALAAVDPGFRSRSARRRRMCPWAERPTPHRPARYPMYQRIRRTLAGAAGRHLRQRDQPSAAGGRRVDAWLHHRGAASAACRATLVRGLPRRRPWLLRDELAFRSLDGRDFSDADRDGPCPSPSSIKIHGRSAVAWREPVGRAPPPARPRESVRHP